MHFVEYVCFAKLQKCSDGGSVDWDDLRCVKALVDGDGLQGGAKRLGVHPTTLARRIRNLEATQRVQLFERFRHKVVLTEAGADALEVARQLDAQVHDLSARWEGRDTDVSGTIRLASVDWLLRDWMPDFARFLTLHPDVQLELSSGIAMANLTQREADVAIRIAGEAPGHLIGNKVCDVAHGVYVSRDLFDAKGGSLDRAAYPWVSYDLSVFRGVDAFLAARVPSAQVVMRVPRIDVLLGALEGGVGAGILNCHAGDGHPHLVRLGPADAGVSHLWLLTHPHLRGAGRIVAFLRFLREVVARDRDLFEGARPQGSPAA